MLRPTLLALTSSLALWSAVAPRTGAYPSAAAQETPTGRTELLTEGDRVKALMARAHGGVDLLDTLTGFKFTLLPSEFEKQEDGTYLEKPGAPFSVEVDYRTGERNVRLEEEQDGQRVVRLIARQGNKVFIGDKPADVPELLGVAQEQARSILQYFDIYLGPAIGRLPAIWDQVRTRDGVQYYCYESRTALGEPLRLYVSQASHRIERVDLFSTKDGKRVRTFLFEEAEPVANLPLPRRLRILDRENKPIGTWRFEALEVNPAFPEKRFEAL